MNTNTTRQRSIGDGCYLFKCWDHGLRKDKVGILTIQLGSSALFHTVSPCIGLMLVALFYNRDALFYNRDASLCGRVADRLILGATPDSARKAIRDWLARGRGNHPVVAGTTWEQKKDVTQNY